MTADRLLGHVASVGLPTAADTASEVAKPLADTAWQTLTAAVRRQRLAGLLVDAIERGTLPATDQQWEDALELHMRGCLAVLHLERRLLEITSLFEREGVTHLVLKGSGVAHLSYPEPQLRLFRDNDVLVATDDLGRAQHLLEGLGYRRQVPELRPDFDRRFGKSITLSGPEGDELDMHRTLVFGSFGFLIDPDELFASASTFALGGHRLRALGPEMRLLHACYHAALGDPVPRYSSVRDVAQMLTTGEHDSAALIDLIRRWRAEAVVARAVGLCRGLLGLTYRDAITALTESHVPGRRERRAIDSYVGADRGFSTKVLASLPYLGTRDRMALLHAALRPSRGAAAARGEASGVAWLRRGLAGVQRRLRRGTGR